MTRTVRQHTVGGFTAVPAQIRGHRCAQYALVDGDSKLIGRCVTASKSANALGAA